VVTHQLQVERRAAKAHRPKTDALPLDHATNNLSLSVRCHSSHKPFIIITQVEIRASGPIYKRF